MSYGFETYRPDTSRNMSGLSSAGVFIEALTLPSNNTGSKSYSMIPGGQINVFHGTAPIHTTSVDTDGSGYARINWSGGSGSGQTILLVFAKKLNEVNPYGLTIRNDSDQVIADYSYPVPQYAGTLSPPAQASASIVCPDGYHMHTHNISTSLKAGTNRIVLVNCQDNGMDVWYSYDSFIPASITGAYTLNLDIFVLGSGGYAVPTLHVFSLDGIVSAGTSYGIQLTRADTSLVYDSSAENLTAANTLDINYPPVGQTYGYVASNMPSVSGVLAPVYSTRSYTTSGSGWIQDRYRGAVRRSGNQMHFKQIRQDSQYTDTQLGALTTPANNNTYCIVVDLAALVPSTYWGTPGTYPPSTYPSYNNPPYIQVYEEDGRAEYFIGPTGTTAGAWFNGSGDPNLYEVMATLTSGSALRPSGTAVPNSWYSLHTNVFYAVDFPSSANTTRTSNFSYQIRIKSNTQVVVNSSFTVSSYRSPDGDIEP